MRSKAKWIVAWVALLGLTSACVPAAGKPRWSAEEEKKIGERAAKEIQKDYVMVDDPATLAKLQNMADVIGANTPRPEVKYRVRYVKEKKRGPEPEVNAFSLPGGIIFVTEGLVKAVHSDHELAGVMGHEITHNVNYDGLTQAERAEKIFKGELAAVLASILVGGLDSDLWPNVMRAGLFYRQGVLGGYSIEMEKRADQGGVEYLIGTPWDPVGLLTFMERLAAKERRDPPPDLGNFKSHPLSMDRVKYLSAHLRRSGVDINRRHTANWDKPKVEEGKINGKPAQIVVYQGRQVFACDKPADGSADPKERATRIAKALEDALADGAQAASFSTKPLKGEASLLAFRKQVIFTAGEDSRELYGKSPAEVARNALKSLHKGLFAEGFGRLY